MIVITLCIDMGANYHQKNTYLNPPLQHHQPEGTRRTILLPLPVTTVKG